MFHKNIVELQKIRKFVDHRKVDYADFPFLSQKLDDISYQITMTIKDLIMCDKIITKQEQQKCITEKNTTQ